MGFKNFRADVSTAAQRAAAGDIPGVLAVRNGDSDGEVAIEYRHEGLPRNVRIQALAQDVSEYPDGNMFMVWSDDPDPPQPVVAAVKAAQDTLIGLSVYDMVAEFAGRLAKEITGAVDGETDAQSDEGDDEDADDYDAAFDADYPSDGEQFGLGSSSPRAVQTSAISDADEPTRRRIRRDLRRVKDAGYKVGLLDAFGKSSTSGMVSISIRVDKLALSEEAMEAWDVKPTEYAVLLLRFCRQYHPLERAAIQPVAQTEVQFRIGKCSRYKPSPSQATMAFGESNRPLVAEPGAESPTQGGPKYEKLFISNSMDPFMCDSFVPLLKIREKHGLDWDRANEYLLKIISRTGDGEDQPETLPESPSQEDSTRAPPARTTNPGPRVLGRDHLLEALAEERSLPLVAMQFAMRYFVRCTEYCLRCHRRLEAGFEALRPYVCSDPLCLFQYMAMGLGPSIEHEILTEPYVVDLLVSLCYSAAQPCSAARERTEHRLSIRDLPVGLRILVPNFSEITGRPLPARAVARTNRLVFEDKSAWDIVRERVAPAKWIAICRPGYGTVWHTRVHEIDTVANAITAATPDEAPAGWAAAASYAPAAPPGVPPGTSSSPRPGGPDANDLVHVYLYDTDFDSLSDDNKANAMRHVLDSLPSILEIEEWLVSHPNSSIRSMERISPAAASLLQWIVSSNRSCIFQVDRSRALSRRRAAMVSGNQQYSVWRQGQAGTPLGPPPTEGPGVAGKGRNREHERISGMKNWIQFRFAQGSPDKELRFNRALQEVAARKQIRDHPTIFAWHGSHLANWHSIVRTGLDYVNVNHGRSYGHGVYFSPKYTTSAGYAVGGQSWPNSDLDICVCLSLNEIINAPDEFVSRNPHYVVAQPDWHQCRYLFVLTTSGRLAIGNGLRAPPEGEPTHATNSAHSEAFFPQAAGLEVYGQDDLPLQIPLSAIPLRTVGSAARSPLGVKRTHLVADSSDDEDGEDADFLFSGDVSEAEEGPPTKKSASRGSSAGLERSGAFTTAAAATPPSADVPLTVTDFRPDLVDLSSVPRLQPPSFATPAATRSISAELKRLQAVQSETPARELGWYMDFDGVTNLYQWIVQLHSFDLELPLAQDMQAAGAASIVLELRFGPDFPFSPPFVRVVRPRFLPFLEGGGGHVTAGGAMCMELLTSSGWSPATSIESLLLQVRMALCSTQPKPARLHPQVVAGRAHAWDYGVSEAIDAYLRAVNRHGWTMPKNLELMARGI